MTVLVFDSGVGGLSVLRQLRTELPDEDVLYAADGAWCPYGPKPAELLRRRIHTLLEALVGPETRGLVVACHTASTLVLGELRARWPGLPVVGIEPAVKPAAARTDSGAIGVLATATTATGEALARLVDRFGSGLAVHVAVPEGLVELIEAGHGDSTEAEELLRPIVERWRAARVDTVVLGCTHYPFALAAIRRVAGPGVQVVDPAPAVARQAARVIGTGGGSGRSRFVTTGDPGELRRVAAQLVPEPWVVEAEFRRLDV